MGRFDSSIALVFALSFWSVYALSLPPAPPHFHLNLDSPPEKRWQGAVTTVLAAHPWEHGFGPAFASHNRSLFNHLTDDHWVLMRQAIEKHWPELALELKSLSQSFHDAGHAVTYDYLCGWVYFHELDHTELGVGNVMERECTGLIMQDTTGHIIHGRNMDQSPTSVRNVTLQITFSKGGKVIFESVDWYWFTTGVMTTVKKGVVSLQENWRFLSQDSKSVFQDIKAGVVPQVFVFRSLNTNDSITDFESAVDFLINVRMATPEYIVAAGPNAGQGIIIPKVAQKTAEKILRLGDPSGLSIFKSWYLVQTNYDWWKSDPPSDSRRTDAIHALDKMQQDIAACENGTDVIMTTPHVRNTNTAYTAIMKSSIGQLHAYVWP